MRIMQLLKEKKNIRLLAAGLAVAMLAGLLLIFPRSGGIERYQDLYERGEYRACQEELARELRQNPDWHDGRQLLLQVELKLENPIAALENLLILWAAGEDSEYSALVLIELSQEHYQEEARQVLEEKLAHDPHLYPARELAVQLELTWGYPEQAMQHMSILAERGVEQLPYRLTKQVFDYLMEAGELVLAQEFALEVDRQVWITNVISTVEKLPVDVHRSWCRKCLPASPIIPVC